VLPWLSLIIWDDGENRLTSLIKDWKNFCSTLSSGRCVFFYLCYFSQHSKNKVEVFALAGDGVNSQAGPESGGDGK
jgi:hypothetical protein